VLRLFWAYEILDLPMKLVLYSGGTGKDNKALVREGTELLRHKELPVITFIPVEGDDAAHDFKVFQGKFRDLKVGKFQCIPIDRRLSAKAKKALFSSDAIFLGGGNTYYFLKHLRENKLLPRLRAFVKRGGVLMGLSAGSIVMTPSIMTAAVPVVDSDENEVGLTDLKALGLVPFEFSPHYYRSKVVDRELKDYSKSLPHPIYACKDGQGIVVENGKIRFIGRVNVFHRGEKYTIQ
jgi:dipeptidase E